MDLNALADLPLTYPEVGATATGRLPAGYNHLDVSTQIGTGRQRFEQAADAVMHWGMQRNAGLRVRASSETAVVSAVVLVGIAFLRAPCRVVYVIDEPDVRGFGYGTLPGHPVSGEERFAVRCDPMTSVVFAEVLSFSRPATWASKAAVRDGDHYIVNGQKVFTTGAHDADYIWLACRTDPNAAKHKGISILIVDTKDPGYSWTPIILADGAHHTNATYYNDVRVPVDMLVGKENDGWRLITTQLNNERVMLGPAGRFASIYDRVHAWASVPGGNGVTPIDHDDVKRALGEIRAIWRINELLNWQVASAGEDINMADAAATKVFGTERVQRAGRLAEEIVGKYGNPAEPDTAELLRWLDAQTKRNLVITFGGGVNEVMREMIAASGLKVPRVPR